jgi:hypothetical protein
MSRRYRSSRGQNFLKQKAKSIIVRNFSKQNLLSTAIKISPQISDNKTRYRYRYRTVHIKVKIKIKKEAGIFLLIVMYRNWSRIYNIKKLSQILNKKQRHRTTALDP